jgi:hypothetical protein
VSDSNNNATSISRSCSGVFIKPVWQRSPGGCEKGMALIFTMLPLVGLFCITLKAAQFSRDQGAIKSRTDNSTKAQESAPRGQALLMVLSARNKSASDNIKKPSRQSDLKQKVTAGRSWLKTTVIGLRDGRRFLNENLQLLAGHIGGKARNFSRGSWAGIAIVCLLGPLFCFFAWPLRRTGTALLGAFVFGAFAYGLARSYHLNWSGALVISLAPAFLGALLGWHLLVLYTTALSGEVLGGVVFLLAITFFSIPAWLPAPLLMLVIWSLATAFVYLLALRPALISGWAVFGAVIISASATILTGCFSRGVPLWDLFLSVFVLFSILGTLSQYRRLGDQQNAGQESDPEISAQAQTA